jgi:hypothetical protein
LQLCFKCTFCTLFKVPDCSIAIFEVIWFDDFNGCCRIYVFYALYSLVVVTEVWLWTFSIHIALVVYAIIALL